MNFKLKVAAAAKSLQSCPTLCNSIDGSPPGSYGSYHYVIYISQFNLFFHIHLSIHPSLICSFAHSFSTDMYTVPVFVPGTVLSTLHKLAHLIFIMLLSDKSLN